MNWDYTELAKHYDKRPGYSKLALKTLYEDIGVNSSWSVIDMGAGTGKLTKSLCSLDCEVTAVEPNLAMREIGEKNIKVQNCRWLEAVAENTELPDKSFDLVIYGSSFNVVNQSDSLEETARLLRPDKWFACLWNHRDLSDPLQRSVENIVQFYLPYYEYGVRRRDQTKIINACESFGTVKKIETRFVHKISALDYIEAWRSHATLARQAGRLLSDIIRDISNLLANCEVLDVPYNTRIWYASKIR